MRSTTEKMSEHVSGATGQFMRRLVELLIGKDVAMVLVTGGVGTLFLGEYLGLQHWFDAAAAAFMTSATIFILLFGIYFWIRRKSSGAAAPTLSRGRTQYIKGVGDPSPQVAGRTKNYFAEALLDAINHYHVR